MAGCVHSREASVPAPMSVVLSKTPESARRVASS